MEYNIRAYVDELFENAPKTQKAYELKIELTQNLIDKYNALINEGKSPEDAYNLTVISIGDVRELFEGLEDGPIPSQPAYYPQMDGAKKHATITAIAVMLYILSVVPLIVLDSLFPGDFGGTLGLMLMFVMIAAATGLLIYNHATKPKKVPPAENVVSDFKQWQTHNSSNKQLLKAIRSAYWPLVLAFYFLLSFGTGKWHITWIIFLIAPAVDGIIKSVLTLTDSGRK